MLAEDVLPLLLRHLGLRLAGDLPAQFQHLDFVCQKAVDKAQRFQSARDFEELLLLLDIEAEHRRQERNAEKVQANDTPRLAPSQ